MIYAPLVLLTIIFACQSLFCKLYTDNYKGSNPASASNVYSVFYGLFIGIATLGLNRFSYAPSSATLICGLINAAILLLYNTSLVNASRRGSYDFMMICMLSGGMLVPIFWEMIFGGQMITLEQGIALVLLLVSFVLMNLKGLGERGSKAYYFWCAVLFLTNGFYGVLMNEQQTIMNGTQREEMIATTYFVMGVAALVMTAVRGGKQFREGFRMGKKSLIFALLACLMATAASNTFVYLISRVDSLALLYAFNNGGVLVVSAILSAILFHEKLLPPRLLGMLFACGGIVLLCL